MPFTRVNVVPVAERYTIALLGVVDFAQSDHIARLAPLVKHLIADANVAHGRPTFRRR